VGSQDIQLGKCARAPDRRDDGRVRYVVIRRARLRIARLGTFLPIGKETMIDHGALYASKDMYDPCDMYDPGLDKLRGGSELQ
jgi:hypothetical protein